VVLDPAEGADGVAPIPGTQWASSVAVGGNKDTLYYTIGGDSMVYRRVRSTGVIDTVYDFGALGIARDVQVRNGRMTAVVGGNVTWIPHASLGMAQYDSGGPVYVVDLPAGLPALVTQSYDRYRFPALSRDGAVVVAQQANDLWAITLP
jgi:Tol biopolymer transport system component